VPTLSKMKRGGGTLSVQTDNEKILIGTLPYIEKETMKGHEEEDGIDEYTLFIWTPCTCKYMMMCQCTCV
jgi:hypothetical protein